MAKKAVSCVTRAKRDGEVEGYDYYFMTDDEIRQKDRSEFFNFEVRSGGIYGMLWSEIKKSPKLVVLCGKSGSGKDTLLRGTDEFPGLMDNPVFDDVTFAIFDQDGVNSLLAKEAALGADLFIVWVRVPEDLRRERVVARDGNADRADNCWVKQPNRIDLVVESNGAAAKDIEKMLYDTCFVPDISAEYMYTGFSRKSVTARRAIEFATENDIACDTPFQAIQIAQEMIGLPHSASGMMLETGKVYYSPDPFAFQEGFEAEYQWSEDSFDIMLRNRGLICSTPEIARARAIQMINIRKG